MLLSKRYLYWVLKSKVLTQHEAALVVTEEKTPSKRGNSEALLVKGMANSINSNGCSCAIEYEDGSLDLRNFARSVFPQHWCMRGHSWEEL